MGANSQQPLGGKAINQDSAWIVRLQQAGNNLMDKLILDTGNFNTKVYAKNIDTVGITSRKRTFPFVQFMGGQIQYSYNYQSQIDTPLYQPDLSQHLQQVRMGFMLGDFLPVQVSYFGRKSNSIYFKDFYDLRIDIDAKAMRDQYRSRLIQSLAKEIDSAKADYLPLQLEDYLWNFNELNHLFNSPDLSRLIIESKDKLLHAEEWDKANFWQDSARKVAARFLSIYHAAEQKRDSLDGLIDSLHLRVQEYGKTLGEIRKQLSDPGISVETVKRLSNQLANLSGRGSVEKKIPGWMKGLDRISIGRTLPHISQLTTSNINVRGVNMSFTGDAWFADIAAGVIDFRLRDYVFDNSGKAAKQWVATGKMGWGRRNGTYFALAGYHGRKQVYGTGRGSDLVNGLSAEIKWQISKYHSLLGEVAQSGTVGTEGTAGKSSAINFSNRHTRAYFASWRSSFPKSGTFLEGRYQRMGIHFQSFNSFRINAATESWSLAFNQHLWRNILRFRFGVSRNDMTNSLIPQRFTSNAILKTAALTFRKRNWPVLSLGWMPSKQIVVTDSVGYELNFQTFTGNAFYEYKVGVASFASHLSFSWFDLKESEAGFLAGQTRQMNFLQYFRFPLHNATIGFSNMRSDSISYRVFQVGSDAVLWKTLRAEAGCRIHNFNGNETRAGFYGRISWNAGKPGQFSLVYDDLYLPSVRKALYRNQQLSITYIKNLNRF